jgi:hypothetical protein
MSTIDLTSPLSRANLALLEKYANTGPVRKLVNLLILRMLLNKIPALIFARDGAKTKILIRAGDGYSQSPDWKPIPVSLHRIHRRLTFMAGPPLPCWHDFPLWYRLPFQFTERFDHWFWRPRPMEFGKFEIWTTDASYWVDFKADRSGKIELSYARIR